MTFSVPPYLRDPDPAPEPVPQFTIRTRNGTEWHNQADEHRAGPSCPCGPRIQWPGRDEEGSGGDSDPEWEPTDARP